MSEPWYREHRDVRGCQNGSARRNVSSSQAVDPCDDARTSAVVRGKAVVYRVTA